MTALIRNRLTMVWALLTCVTVVSWLMARDGGAAHQLNATVTVVVLLIAAVKAQLVVSQFMEVRSAPRWLKATTSGWVLALFALLLGVYFGGH
ncbi:cytochrome C oxidase subunit IV family protein [Candidatus Mycobacterium wuenschmannii]|uniref:Cytochrome C oxidase subunit IV family protein n=1 Tax=Candidatus Mycobacterium wuenschmannii TaxID=3027808 RepID=A0ABY8VRV0_9MYCO|nr:cytochrome C oxidase subunit IV family protein [Candidatus Mycobacterium wuenschmannii]WIM86056.1 cytochrome C oxidase subunit IV family protein [Candidatus Mycobacterium wuenschmannii]